MRVHARATAVAILVAGGLLSVPASPATAVQTAQGKVVGSVPPAYTPMVQNGTVKEIAQVGNTVVLGGTFTSTTLGAGSATIVTRDRILAFDADTGAVDPGFAPSFDAEVSALAAGPTPGTVYVGGAFKTLNGATRKALVLLNLRDGSPVSGFTAPYLNGVVNDLKLSTGRLFIGGTFSKISGVAHAGIATLNPGTGKPDPYLSLQVAGHHNYNVNCIPTATKKCSTAAVGVSKLDISPNGSRLVMIGNFTSVSGYSRDQVAMLDVSGSAAATVASWQTSRYNGECFSGAYDSWIRDVDFAPDGSYFVIGSTGGYPRSYVNLCDSVARWETGATGAGLDPTWVDWTGGDTIFSVAATGTAIYAGGHQRWMNNQYGSDFAGPGAVPRPGLAALDPVNGVPLAWNPGRNPRGAGAYALLATPDGLYVGSDTNFIGNYRYKRQRIAFFPLSAGTAIAPDDPGSLPGTVYQAGPLASLQGRDDVNRRTFDGTTPGPTATLGSTGVAWNRARGGFMLNGTLWYGWDDGTFHKRTFNGSTFGADKDVQPYHDPYWMNVRTGSGNSSNPAGTGYYYDGQNTGYYGELSSVTGSFYRSGRIYYSLSGKPGLFSRYFSADSGIIGSQEFAVPVGIANFSAAAGLFVSGSSLYYGDAANGSLRRVSFSNGVVSGTPTVVSSPLADGAEWRARAMFLFAP